MCLCQKIAVLILGFKQLLKGKKSTLGFFFFWTTKLPFSKQRHFKKCLYICTNCLFFGHLFVDHSHATERMSCGIVVGLKSWYTCLRLLLALLLTWTFMFGVQKLIAAAGIWVLMTCTCFSSIYLAVHFDHIKTWPARTVWNPYR